MPPLKVFLKIYQGVILSGALLAGSVMLLVFGIVPAARVSSSTFGEIQKTAEVVSALNKKVAILKSLDEVNAQKQLAGLLSAIPADASVPVLLSSLDLIAGKVGLSLTDVTMDVAKSASDAAALKKVKEAVGASIPLPLTVNGLGSAISVRDFFVQSLMMKRLVRIRNFDITYPTGTTATVRISLDEFAAPILRKLTSVDQPLNTLSAEEEGVISKLNSAVSAESNLPSSPAVFGKADPFSR